MINSLTQLIDAEELPPELDVELYRTTYSDLRHLNDAQLVAHFDEHGRKEGRVGSYAGARTGFLAAIPNDKPVLELGPFCNPSLRGENIKYFDVLDHDQLCARARDIGLPDEHCPHIDFVSPLGDLSIVDQKFHCVFSSHSIEHQPDLVRHLRDVSNCLSPGGRYFIIIPDKRYCIDHFISESTIADILGAHLEHRIVHSAKSVLEHRILLTHNDPARHWNGDHTDPAYGQRVSRAKNGLRELETRPGEYIDVHAWQFTPESFRSLINFLKELGLCSFYVERIYDTVRGSLEFGAVLRSDIVTPV